MFLHSLRHSFGCICNIHILGVSLLHLYVKHQIYNCTISHSIVKQTYTRHRHSYSHAYSRYSWIFNRSFFSSHHNYSLFSKLQSQHTSLFAYTTFIQQYTLLCAKNALKVVLFQNRKPYILK